MGAYNASFLAYAASRMAASPLPGVRMASPPLLPGELPHAVTFMLGGGSAALAAGRTGGGGGGAAAAAAVAEAAAANAEANAVLAQVLLGSDGTPLVFPGNLHAREWAELDEAETGEIVAGEVVDTIVTRALDTVYNSIISAQIIPFATRSIAEQAARVVNLIDVRRDEGEPQLSDLNALPPGPLQNPRHPLALWMPDDEPPPPPIDAWACGALPVVSWDTLLETSVATRKVTAAKKAVLTALASGAGPETPSLGGGGSSGALATPSAPLTASKAPPSALRYVEGPTSPRSAERARKARAVAGARQEELAAQAARQAAAAERAAASGTDSATRVSRRTALGSAPPPRHVPPPLDPAARARKEAEARQAERDAELTNRRAAEDAERLARARKVETLRHARREFTFDHRGEIVPLNRPKAKALPPATIQPLFAVAAAPLPVLDDGAARRTPRAAAGSAKRPKRRKKESEPPPPNPLFAVEDAMATASFEESVKTAPVATDAIKLAPGVVLKTGERTRAGPRRRTEKKNQYSREEYAKLVARGPGAARRGTLPAAERTGPGARAQQAPPSLASRRERMAKQPSGLRARRRSSISLSRRGAAGAGGHKPAPHAPPATAKRVTLPPLNT
ncbi:uncharacterized protein AMSG_02406 [Thecamonas trahens ATCC 50062]|uniref:Uncharacterized protein n=1 Tax=Thecamonas trahens ATCC 50062 TaxID=461836 RepID=A0A0L0DWH4_THETB|nr:hypothetical protein AMSG_02406 [Thecamonas trahens ATCC 50062]KNC56436.1 hypothetical protein AMSG_02406 [Thecamonas trahens ATCC 50062]|eukprot:XP_013760948.1 hypothetical protein AMSG_02406 [Thecamonas trahens ATCC 50062]